LPTAHLPTLLLGLGSLAGQLKAAMRAFERRDAARGATDSEAATPT
jgi:hypothetical protein